ncbi:MAG TPA: MarR family transcriptional regulator [Arenibacter sp.]|nr:MarR family transcriptional regulator [Arenibacter sp.]
MDMNVEDIIKTNGPIPVESRTLIHVSLVGNKINEIMGQAIKPYGISIQQFNVLRILRGQKGKPANLSTLNERMVTKMSNTTRLVDKLILKGYVNRMTCPSNRRKIEINITPTGEADLLKIDMAIMKAEKEIVKNFSEEDLMELNRLLNKF